mgnify:CR=1 FL=1
MAPIKFEHTIKEKLEERRLQPSEAAWDKLTQKLEADNTKRKGFGIWWFGVAASLIGVFVILNQMNQGDEFIPRNNNSNVVVSGIDSIQNSVDKKVISSKNDVLLSTDKSSSIQEIQPIPSIAKTHGKSSPVKNTAETTDRIVAIGDMIDSKNLDNMANQSKSVRDQVMVDTRDPSKDLNKNSLVEAENNEEELQPVVDIDLEVESLLNSAITNSEPTERSIEIDADALLESVETEMPPSIRRQVFKVIEKNYKTVKTALVTRNK